MALSRYRKSKIVNDIQYSYYNYVFTYDPKDVYWYEVKSKDRLDILAREDLGDEGYWWILARLNNFSFMFDLNKFEKILRIRNPTVFLNQI